MLQALNGLPTLQQRVGNRYWSGPGAGMIGEATGSLPNSAGQAAGGALWGRIEGVHRIMRTLPEVREPFWKTFVEVAKSNPGALRYIVMLMALYLHFVPFSKHVIGEIDRRIAELDAMPPVGGAELAPRAPLDAV